MIKYKNYSNENNNIYNIYNVYNEILLKDYFFTNHFGNNLFFTKQ